MAKTIEKRKPPIRIAGSAEASVGSATTGRDEEIFSNFRRQAIKFLGIFLGRMRNARMPCPQCQEKPNQANQYAKNHLRSLV